MAWLLSATQIRAPHSFNETNNTMTAQNRTLDGTVNRDLFGSNKRIWTLEYQDILPAQYDVIKAIHTTYLTNNTPVAWEVTETNYAVAATTVHVNLDERTFRVRGTDYLSSFRLILTEV